MLDVKALRKKRKTAKGKLNKLVDDVMHPHFKQHPATIIIDGFLHAIVEQNPDESLRKFVKYNLPKLLEASSKKKT